MGWFKYFWNCWSPAVFTQTVSRVLSEVSNGSVDGNALLMREVRGEWPDWLELTDYSNSDNPFLQLWWAEKHLRMHNLSNLEADGLQQQKTTVASTPVSREQKSETAVRSHESWFLSMTKLYMDIRTLEQTQYYGWALGGSQFTSQSTFQMSPMVMSFGVGT